MSYVKRLYNWIDNRNIIDMSNGSRSRQVLTFYHLYKNLLIGLYNMTIDVLSSIVVKINTDTVTKQPYTTTNDKYNLLEMRLNW